MKKQTLLTAAVCLTAAFSLNSCEPSLNNSLSSRGGMSDQALHSRSNSRIDTIEETQTRSAVRNDQYESVTHPLNMANGVLGGLNGIRNNAQYLGR